MLCITCCVEENFAGDDGERTVMNLILAEMSTEERQKNQTTATTKKYASSDSELVYQFAKKNKKAGKNTHEAYRIPLHHSKDAVGLAYNLPSSSAESPNYSRVGGIMETILDQIHHGNGALHGDGPRSTTYVNYTQLDEINMQLAQRSAKAFIDQLFLGRKFGGKDGVSSESKEFSDPLEILISNRSLFPQSLQFALRNSDTIKLSLDAKFSECGTGDSEMLDYTVRNNKQNEDILSRKKVKDRYTYSSNRSSSPQPSNKIVVLKPAQKVLESPTHVTCSCSSLQSHQRLKSKGQNVKPTYFSFKEIKRRLRRALGENQEKRQWISTIGSLYKLPTKKQIPTGAGDQEIKADFSSRKPADPSTDTKRNNKLHEKRDFKSRNGAEITSTDVTECRKSKLSAGGYPKHHKSDIFQEAKKHLSERLRNVNRSEILEKRQAPRTLGRILSSPEHYDLFSPSSPNRDMEHGALSRDTRSPPYKFSIKDNLTPDGDSKILETNDIQRPEGLSTFEVPFESHSNGFTSARLNLNCSVLASPSHDQIVRSSSSLSIYNPEEVDSLKNEEEHQSPVSVLEPLFVEDASSPKSIATQPATGTLLPLRIDFEYQIDPKFDTSVCINEEESISVYVRAVLQDSGLNWDEPLLTRPSPDRALNASSLSHGEKLFPTELDHDPELLFDCVNDVLIEAYQQHFGCSPWTPYLKPKIRSFQPENHLVDEVVKCVKCLLHPQLLQPTLDQLVGQDIAKSASWLDIRFDTEDLVNEIAEEILVESVMETILTLHT